MVSLLFLSAGLVESRLTGADRMIYDQYPAVLETIAQPGISRRPDGLIGRNAEWGALYAPRFQMGSGYAVRVALQADDVRMLDRAFRALQAGVEGISDDGEVLADVPAELKPSPDAQPSDADRASGAAFFLSDACTALLALRAMPQTSLDETVITQVEERLLLALDWLESYAEVLAQADRAAPNRLLFNALAFQACGALSDAPDAYHAVAQAFVGQALELLDTSGYFIEGGGWDTNYQAVALRVGNDLLLAGFDDPDGLLSDGLNRAAAWLADRIDRAGRVNSAGNERTCWGQETFLGAEKSLSLVDVFLGLSYRALDTDDTTFRAAAERVLTAYQANPRADPCYRPTD